MNSEQRKQYMRDYAREYTAAGFNAYNAKQFRQRHADEVRAKDRERKRKMRALLKGQSPL